jgi:hypothetical protein
MQREQSTGVSVRTMRSAGAGSLGFPRAADGRRVASVAVRCFSSCCTRAYVERRSTGAEGASVGSLNRTRLEPARTQNSSIDCVYRWRHSCAHAACQTLQRVRIPVRLVPFTPSFLGAWSVSPSAFNSRCRFARAWAAFLSAACLCPGGFSFGFLSFKTLRSASSVPSSSFSSDSGSLKSESPESSLLLSAEYSASARSSAKKS